jgi:hypothetical protein
MKRKPRVFANAQHFWQYSITDFHSQPLQFHLLFLSHISCTLKYLKPTDEQTHTCIQCKVVDFDAI